MSQFDQSLLEGGVKLYSRQLSREPGASSSKKTVKAKKKTTSAAINFLAEAEKKYASNRPYFSCVKKPRAISLFSGCGGLCLGFKQAGFRILGFVELIDNYRKTYEMNFPEPLCLGSDICKITDEELDRYASLLSPVDVVFGGPPCQGFSLAGKRDAKDKRNTLFQEQIRFIRHFQPKVVLLENVRLLTSMKTPQGGFVIDEIMSSFEEIGYHCEFQELNAQDYGVPQFRERVIFLAVKKGVKDLRVSFPEPTHEAKPSRTFFGHSIKYGTFRDATADLEPLESGEASETDPYHWAVTHPERVIRWLKDVPEGESAHDNIDPDNRPPCGYNTTYKRIKWDEPCSTIGTTFGMISGCRNVHPVNTRSLTVREAMRCQTFPDDFKFEGNWGDIRTMIGNAVPPLFAQSLAAHIAKTILRGRQ